MRKLLFLSILILTISCKKDGNEPTNNSNQMQNEDTVTYLATINYRFNESLFPNTYPNNAHFSPIIGWSHNNTSDIFSLNEIATNGIKSMAETGSTNSLSSEINTKIENNLGHSLHIGSGLSIGQGSITLEVEVCKSNSYITLVSMIAPSPDWFVAFKSINLLENNMFVNEATQNGYLFDAGTDNGINYTSVNSTSNPQENVSYINGLPVYTSENQNEIIATIHFSKI